MGRLCYNGRMAYFDTHVHLMPPRRLASLIRWMKRAIPSHPVAEDTPLDALVAELRANGAVWLVNHVFPLKVGEAPDLHDFNARLATEIPRLLPFAGVHPDDPDRVRETVRALDKLGLVGVKIHCMVQRVDPWDARLHPVYAELARRRRPLWLHTGYEDFYHFAFPDDHLRRLAEGFPDMPVVLAHAIFPRLETAFALAADYPNVYLDMTNVFGSVVHAAEYAPGTPPAAVERMREVLRAGVERHAGRVMFGTDHPVGLGDVAQILGDMQSVAVAEEARRAMLWETPVTLFSQWAARRLDA
ncbi:MAG: hypothetical protein D6796_10180 [Caldilineae bacterium]|nr:MAG: hypothetical protein D6796_10180 [Caldilineae bacterium]